MRHDQPDNADRPRRAQRRVGRAVVPTEEKVLLDRRPSLWFIPLNAGPTVLAIVLTAGALDAGATLFLRAFASVWASSPEPTGAGQIGGWIMRAAVLLSCAVVIWSVLDWLTRRYVLTDRRAIAIFGVLHQRVCELALHRVQNVSISKPLLLRVLGLGHVGIASAGTDGYEIVWRTLPCPERCAAQVREAVDRPGAVR
ncbi:MAG: PH domain-containing protein [Phycisphaerales bacterium]